MLDAGGFSYIDKLFVSGIIYIFRGRLSAPQQGMSRSQHFVDAPTSPAQRVRITQIALDDFSAELTQFGGMARGAGYGRTSCPSASRRLAVALPNTPVAPTMRIIIDLSFTFIS
jgi:hypothetical protein